MALPLPQLEGKYEILEKIKEGGMGAIYKVRHTLLGEVRVIKVMRPQHADDETARKRFFTEAKKHSRLTHPNIVQLYDFSVDQEGTAYIVIEFIDGMTLQQILREGGPPPVQLGLELAIQGLRALDYLHRRGFVHRDIAPDNLMVTRDVDDHPTVKLIDLGIAKAMKGGGEGLTQAGTFIGKVKYASPEQFRTGEGMEIDSRSDLYSYGLVLFELLTGRYAYDIGRSADFSTLVACHLVHPPRDFDNADPEGLIPGELREIVLSMLEKDRDKRASDARDLQKQLRAVQRSLPELDLEAELQAALHRGQTVRLPRSPMPGTTQAELDANFPPEADTQAPDTVDDATEVLSDQTDASRVEDLLRSAEQQIASEELETAAEQLREALRIDPDQVQATRMLADVLELKERREAERRRAAEEARRRQQIEDAVGRSRSLVERAEFDSAAALLRQLRSDLGDDPAIEPALREVDDRRLRWTVAEVEKALGEDRLEDAVAFLGQAESALGSVPALAELHGRVDEAREARARRAEEQRHEAAVEAAVEGIVQQIDKGDFAAARTRLGKAREALGADARFERVATELTRRHLGAVADAVEGEVARGELDQAEKRLQKAERELGAQPGLAELRARVTEARDTRAREEAERRRAEEEARRAAELERVVGEARRGLAGGDFGATRKILAAGRDALGELTPLVELEAEVDRSELATLERAVVAALDAGRVDEASRLLGDSSERLRSAGALGALEARVAEVREELGRQEQATIECQGAEQALSAGRLDEAATRIDRARSLDPQNAEPQRLQEILDRKLAERRELEERERRLEEAVGRAGAALERLELGSARETLEQARQGLGDEPRLIELEQRVGVLEGALADARSRLAHALEVGRDDPAAGRQQLAPLVGKGDRSLSAEVRAVLPALAQEIETARRELEERQQQLERRRAVAEASEELERRLQANEVAQARKLLDEATRQWGSEPFAEQAKRLAAAERAARSAEASELVNQGAGHFEAGRLGQAAELFRRAGAIEAPEREVAGQWLARTEEKLEEERAARERAEAIAEARSEVAALLERGKLKQAERALARAEGSWSDADELAALRTDLERRRAATPPRPAIPRGLLISAAVVLVVVVAVVAVMLRGGRDVAPVPTVTGALIDAAPWARITALEALDGQSVPPLEDDSTPLRLALEPGRYRVSMTAPDGSQETLEFEVEAGSLERLRAVFANDPDAFLEEFGLTP